MLAVIQFNLLKRLIKNLSLGSRSIGGGLTSSLRYSANEDRILHYGVKF